MTKYKSSTITKALRPIQPVLLGSSKPQGLKVVTWRSSIKHQWTLVTHEWEILIWLVMLYQCHIWCDTSEHVKQGFYNGCDWDVVWELIFRSGLGLTPVLFLTFRAMRKCAVYTYCRVKVLCHWRWVHVFHTPSALRKRRRPTGGSHVFQHKVLIWTRGSPSCLLTLLLQAAKATGPLRTATHVLKMHARSWRCICNEVCLKYLIAPRSFEKQTHLFSLIFDMEMNICKTHTIISLFWSIVSV